MTPYTIFSHAPFFLIISTLSIGLLTTPTIMSAMNASTTFKSDHDIQNVTLFYHEKQKIIEASYQYGNLITYCTFDLETNSFKTKSIKLDGITWTPTSPNREIKELLHRAIKRFLRRYVLVQQQENDAPKSESSSNLSKSTASSQHALSNVSEEDFKSAQSYQAEISTQESVQDLQPVVQAPLIDSSSPCCKSKPCIIL